jgi:hypothetical protein
MITKQLCDVLHFVSCVNCLIIEKKKTYIILRTKENIVCYFLRHIFSAHSFSNTPVMLGMGCG